MFIGTVFLLCVPVFLPSYAFTRRTLPFVYTSPLRTPHVTLLRRQSFYVISTLYIPSLQVHTSHISRRRVYPSQICMYSHFRWISLRSPTAVRTPLNSVYTLTSGAYLPHLPPQCVPSVCVYPFSWCLAVVCMHLFYKRVSQTLNNLLERLGKEGSPPLCIPFVWMHSLPPTHLAHRPAHRRPSSVCIRPRS